MTDQQYTADMVTGDMTQGFYSVAIPLVFVDALAAAINASPLWAEHKRLQAEVKELREALQSIADNSCCESCQEAAKVAREALKTQGANQ